jgi:hypothetical protein
MKHRTRGSSNRGQSMTETSSGRGAQQEMVAAGRTEFSPSRQAEEASGLVSRNPAPEASPPCVPSGIYRDVAVSR